MKTLAELKKMRFIPHHDCALCGSMVGWYPQEPNPFFDPSCDCVSGDSLPIYKPCRKGGHRHNHVRNIIIRKENRGKDSRKHIRKTLYLL